MSYFKPLTILPTGSQAIAIMGSPLSLGSGIDFSSYAFVDTLPTFEIRLFFYKNEGGLYFVQIYELDSEVSAYVLKTVNVVQKGRDLLGGAYTIGVYPSSEDIVDVNTVFYVQEY